MEVVKSTTGGRAVGFTVGVGRACVEVGGSLVGIDAGVGMGPSSVGVGLDLGVGGIRGGVGGGVGVAIVIGVGVRASVDVGLAGCVAQARPIRPITNSTITKDRLWT